MMETTKSRYLSQRYPILSQVPADLRQKMVKKAVLHPLCLLFLFVCALFILPLYLDYTTVYFGLDKNSPEKMLLLKLFVISAIPFFFIFYFMRKVIIPYCLKGIVKKFHATPKKL